jgi:hypothetical protein
MADPVRFPQEAIEGSEAVRVEIKHNNQTIGFIHVEENRTLLKANQPRRPIGRAQVQLASELSVDECDFDLRVLSYQIGNECLGPPGANGNYGAHNPQAVSHNNTLVVRIETLLNSPDMSCFFSTTGVDICTAIEEFIADRDARALVLSFERVSYKHNTRELLLNPLLADTFLGWRGTTGFVTARWFAFSMRLTSLLADQLGTSRTVFRSMPLA